MQPINTVNIPNEITNKATHAPPAGHFYLPDIKTLHAGTDKKPSPGISSSQKNERTYQILLRLRSETAYSCSMEAPGLTTQKKSRPFSQCGFYTRDAPVSGKCGGFQYNTGRPGISTSPGRDGILPVAAGLPAAAV
ncbi:hypothetical protein EGM51_07300 [Verrucomicrobia bacterium S94]|nr:hypothetical protein EGM51_07300 [Verrucomicrobia bacterium S94]